MLRSRKDFVEHVRRFAHLRRKKGYASVRVTLAPIYPTTRGGGGQDHGSLDHVYMYIYIYSYMIY